MTSQAGMAFWDETTKELLGWPEVLAMLQPLSKAGVQAKREMRPFLPGEQAAWQERIDDLQVVRAAMEAAAWTKELSEELRAVPEVGALLQLIGQGASLRQVDFFEVKQFLWHGWAVERLLTERGISFPWWERLAWEELLRKLNPPGDLVPSFALAELSGDAELVRLRQELAELEAALFAEKRAQSERLRERYGRKPDKDGQLVFDKLDGALGAVRQDGDLVLVQETMFEAVFRVAESEKMSELLRQREAKLVEIEEQETVVLQALVAALRPFAAALVRALEAIGRLDLTLAKASLANHWETGWVEWATAQTESTASAAEAWRLEAAFHPVARAAVEVRGGVFTRLDLELEPGVGLITGPNMGGKTVVLKTLGLLQALAQHAMPIPANGFRFRPVERIGMSGGDEQSLHSGLSSFGAEMQRIAELVNAPGNGLLLLDEVARTTNPEEGEALAIGLASYLLESGHTALFASHFPGVTEVPGMQLFRVAGLNRAVFYQLTETTAPDGVLHRLYSAMDYRLLKSRPGDVPQDAVRLAECFGLPQAVLEQTRAVLQRKEGPTR